ncbi:Zinc finger RING/FYVE/PHD-type protein [Dioscorea alata]|uniref:Zinc finger RING/FYVE/PHD-type protein n=3 Tax=Dioscorea alata TaxID=55571 RepID=A0ACB7WT08_DIOAL|nr:Zinc finger RING/FYVE/PHD-type protein [Dioscorea alata]
MDRGAMDREIIGGLINSVSRYIHLAACQNMKSAAIKGFGNMVGILKLLKVVLDEVLNSEMLIDEQLIEAAEKLDAMVNEAREIMERRPQRMSKICSVLQTESIMLKARNVSLEICDALSKLQESSSFSSNSFSVQQCMQELQCVEQGRTSELIEIALKDECENVTPSLEDTIKIMENLGLASNRELLMESIALEKERIRAELKKKTEYSDHIYQIIRLVSHFRHCMANIEQLGFLNGKPIPSYFRCPLSLELMVDPVIVASGQTYERSFIQKWLDNGLRICPNTRQPLDHINLIQNFTVKALIANWCEENNIKLSDSIQSEIISLPFSPTGGAPEELSPGNSFRDSLHRVSSSRSSLEYVKSEEQSFFAKHHQLMSDKEIVQHCGSANQQSCCHSKSESISSTISSIDILSKFDEKVSLSEEINYTSPWPSKDQLNNSKNIHNDGIGTHSQVQKLVEDLKSRVSEVQTAAASELRLLAKNDKDNRNLIAECGAIPPLVSLLYSKIKRVQENAVTALLNLSINDNNKILIAEAGTIEPLIQVLESGNNEAKENAAATLFSLSVLEEYKIKIGRTNAVKALVYLLGFGSLRGKKDAAAALFNLSIYHENKARIVKAGAVKYLVEMLDPNTGMADKSVALLANISTIPEGRSAIAQEGGIPLLVDTMETGSQRGKENAVSALYQLCINSQKLCSIVLQEGAVPPLIALSQFGTPRAKEKAQQILSHFRSQRAGVMGKVKT